MPADRGAPGRRGKPSGPLLSSLRDTFSTAPKWLHLYDDFITKNASQVSQIESALRSLTYIIPGRFRDAEIASETIHSGVQLLSLYHDTLLLRALARPRSPGLPQLPSLHSRYTRFWTQRSSLYRRVALVLQVVQYTELLCEMAAKRRGERIRWRVVMLIEAVKAVCRLLLLRVTRSRAVVSPPLPEREPVPEDATGSDDDDAVPGDVYETEDRLPARDDERGPEARGVGSPPGAAAPHEREWPMPRTGTFLPPLPSRGDTGSYLLSRVLSAEDIKPAAKLLQSLQGSARTAEVLHVLAPLVYAVSLARSKDKKSWTPWLSGLAVELASRHLRDQGLRTSPLERDEWSKRGWAMGWWLMRGAAYETLTKGVVRGVRTRMPGLVAGIIEDYEYLWENYYFSTSP